MRGFLDRSISAFQSISRNSEGHVESVQPIKCMIFILICNNDLYLYEILDNLIYPAMTAFTDQYSLPNILFDIGQL